MPTLTVNGTEITVPDGTNLIGAAAKVGSHVPHYCYHPDLEVVASCRICFVYREAPGPGGHVMKGLVTACSTPAGDGMIVETDSDDVVKARQDILEFLLINHPTDCPVCDQAGECKLQDYAFAHGHTHSRMTEAKRTLPTKELSSGIRLYTNRCILCDRCVRFLRDYVGTGELSIMNRGNRNEIDIFPGMPVDNVMAGNIVNLCPVGALLSEDFLFKARVWNLRSTPSTCPGCSKGCNTHLDQMNNELQRVRPKPNMKVQGRFICDKARELYKTVRSDDRLVGASDGGDESSRELSWDDGVAKASDIIRDAGDDAVFIATTHTSNEALTALRELASVVGSERLAYIPNAHSWPEQSFPGGFTIPGDTSPNTPGAKEILGRTLEELIADGQASGAVVLNTSWNLENVSEQDLERLKRLGRLVVIDVKRSAISQLADVLLPGRYWAEERASFTNDQGLEQGHVPSVIAPEGTRSAERTLRDLAQALETAQQPEAVL